VLFNIGLFYPENFRDFNNVRVYFISYVIGTKLNEEHEVYQLQWIWYVLVSVG